MSLRQRTLVTLTAAGLMAGGSTVVAAAAHAAPAGPPHHGGYTLSCEDGTSVARATTRRTRVKLEGGSLGRDSRVRSRAATLRLQVFTRHSQKSYTVDNPCRDRRDRGHRHTWVTAPKPTFTDPCGVDKDRVRFAWTKGVDVFLNGKKVTSFDTDLAAKPGDEIRVESWRGYRLSRDSYRGGKAELSDTACKRPHHRHEVVKAAVPKVTDNCGTDKDSVRFAWTKGVDYYLNGSKVNSFDKELSATPGDRVVAEAWRGYRLARDSYRGGTLELTDTPCKPKRGHGHH